jgi:hypothetical protein
MMAKGQSRFRAIAASERRAGILQRSELRLPTSEIRAHCAPDCDSDRWNSLRSIIVQNLLQAATHASRAWSRRAISPQADHDNGIC